VGRWWYVEEGETQWGGGANGFGRPKLGLWVLRGMRLSGFIFARAFQPKLPFPSIMLYLDILPADDHTTLAAFFSRKSGTCTNLGHRQKRPEILMGHHSIFRGIALGGGRKNSRLGNAILFFVSIWIAMARRNSWGTGAAGATKGARSD